MRWLALFLVFACVLGAPKQAYAGDSDDTVFLKNGGDVPAPAAPPATPAPATEMPLVDLDPPPPPVMKRRIGMMVAGIALMSAGGALAFTGGVLIMQNQPHADGNCTSSSTCAGTKNLESEGIALTIVGGVVMAVGIPLFILGLQKRPVAQTNADYQRRLAPALTLGPAVFAKDTFGLRLWGSM